MRKLYESCSKFVGKMIEQQYVQERCFNGIKILREKSNA